MPRSRPAGSTSSTARSRSRACSRRRSPRLKDEFAGTACRHGRGEHPIALPRRAAHGDLQQDRPDAAHHRQQERDGGRLRDPVRRHGRRLRAHQGLQQAAGLPARAPGGTRSRASFRRGSSSGRRRRSCGHDQKDTDSLPPYEVLDPILEAFIEEDLSVDQIAARGFDRATVGRILDLVKRNEYKRRQAPPGRARERPRVRPRLALSRSRAATNRAERCASCRPRSAALQNPPPPGLSWLDVVGAAGVVVVVDALGVRPRGPSCPDCDRRRP